MNEKNNRKKKDNLTAKQKFHEDMVLGSKFIQDWYLFPTVPVDGVEYAYDEFLRSVALFLHRRTMALEIQDLGISLFGASRYPCFDNILEFGQPGFYGVINNVARIEKLTEEENKIFARKMRKQHHIFEVKKSELIYKIVAASGEFYVGLSTVNPSFALLLNNKIEQNKKVNSVLDNPNLNRMTLDREIFSALNFMDDFGGAMGSYFEIDDGDSDDEFDDIEETEDMDEADVDPSSEGNLDGGLNNSGHQVTGDVGQMTLEFDDAKSKEPKPANAKSKAANTKSKKSSPNGTHKNNKPKSESMDNKKPKKKP